MKVGTAAATLLHLAIFAGALAKLATLPLLPGYLPEGAIIPGMDEAEVRAAARELMLAAGALWHASLMMAVVKAPHGVLLRLYAAGAIAYAAYRAWDVVPIVAAWLRHIQGPRATSYRLTIASPFAVVAFFVVVRLVITVHDALLQ